MSFERFLSNKALTETPAAFERSSPQPIGAVFRPDGPPDFSRARFVRTNGELLPDGDMVFRVAAEGAHSVTMDIGMGQARLELRDRGDGIFEGTLPYSPAVVGPKTVDLRVDGAEVLSPYLPIFFGGLKTLNYVEIPAEGEDFFLLRDVPHGAVTRELVFSETLGEWQRCLIYTPPGYQKSGADYPVLYLQHGAGENETGWVYNGKLAYILDNLLAEGKCVPMLVVMCNGLVKLPHERGIIDSFDGVEGMLTRDVRAFVEENYRARTDKNSRALAGLSLGSMQTSQIGMSHPELYGYLGLFSGFLRRRDHWNTYAQNPYLRCLDDRGRFAADYRLFFRCEGDADGNFPEFQEDDAYLADRGIDTLPGYVRRVYPGCAHEWRAWRLALRDFAPLLFR